MSSVLELQAAELTLSAMGQRASILITDTTAITGKFRAIYVLSDAVFTTLTSDITKNGPTTASVGSDFGTVLSGSVLYGKITAITLASGKVLAYK